MNRRSFLSLFGAGVAGIALEQAIPFNRVWSFPKRIIPASCIELGPGATVRFIRAWSPYSGMIKRLDVLMPGEPPYHWSEAPRMQELRDIDCRTITNPTGKPLIVTPPGSPPLAHLAALKDELNARAKCRDPQIVGIHFL